MPIGSVVNLIPTPVFLAIHLVAFAIGALFAYRLFGQGQRGLGWGFALFAIAEVSYMTYHLDWTTFLFAHTVAEVLDLLAFVTIFVTLGQRAIVSVRAS